MKVEKFLNTMVNAEALIANKAFPETVWEYLESQGVNVDVEQLFNFTKGVEAKFDKQRFHFWH